MSDDRPAVASGGMVPLYTQVRGAEIQIGGYGLACNVVPAMVPEAVAVELAYDHRLGPAPLAPLAGYDVVSEPESPEDEAKPRKRRKEK